MIMFVNTCLAKLNFKKDFLHFTPETIISNVKSLQLHLKFIHAIIVKIYRRFNYNFFQFCKLKFWSNHYKHLRPFSYYYYLNY